MLLPVWCPNGPGTHFPPLLISLGSTNTQVRPNETNGQEHQPAALSIFSKKLNKLQICSHFSEKCYKTKDGCHDYQVLTEGKTIFHVSRLNVQISLAKYCQASLSLRKQLLEGELILRRCRDTGLNRSGNWGLFLVRFCLKLLASWMWLLCMNLYTKYLL